MINPLHSLTPKERKILFELMNDAILMTGFIPRIWEKEGKIDKDKLEELIKREQLLIYIHDKLFLCKTK